MCTTVRTSFDGRFLFNDMVSFRVGLLLGGWHGENMAQKLKRYIHNFMNSFFFITASCT